MRRRSYVASVGVVAVEVGAVPLGGGEQSDSDRERDGKTHGESGGLQLICRMKWSL